MRSPIFNAIILYLLIMTIIVLIKPKALYDHNNNKFKDIEFNDGSINILVICCIGLSIFIYYLVNVV